MNPPYVVAYRNPLEAWFWESGIAGYLAVPIGLIVLAAMAFVFLRHVRMRNGWRARHRSGWPR